MAIQAVVFDLFGTLVYDRFSGEDYPRFLSGLAARLGLDGAGFADHWQSTYVDRSLGRFKTLQDNLRWVGERMGKSLDPKAVEEAASEVLELTRQALTPREHSLETLQHLRRMRFKTALISDCGPAVPLVWNGTPFPGLFDAVAFSCKEGMKKPDPRFYRNVLERLDLRGPECFYLGDGHSGELDGAKGMGMKAALIWSAIGPEEPERLVVKDWDGITLRSLREVAGCLGS